MRVPAMLAAVAMVLAACSGDKKADDTTNDTTPTAAVPAPPAAGTGTTHEVQMVQEGAEYKFLPANLTIKQGDVVVFKSVSGSLHNVEFYADSIPAGADVVLNANIPNRQGPLASELVDAGQSVTISFAGAPVGEYRFKCLPHEAMGMKGMITVQ